MTFSIHKMSGGGSFYERNMELSEGDEPGELPDFVFFGTSGRNSVCTDFKRRFFCRHFQ